MLSFPSIYSSKVLHFQKFWCNIRLSCVLPISCKRQLSLRQQESGQHNSHRLCLSADSSIKVLKEAETNAYRVVQRLHCQPAKRLALNLFPRQIAIGIFLSFFGLLLIIMGVFLWIFANKQHAVISCLYGVLILLNLIWFLNVTVYLCRKNMKK